MSGKKNTRPLVTQETGQAESGTVCKMALASVNHSTTPAAERQSLIALYGPKNGQTIRDLERLTGRRSREIRKQIETERRSGALIISDNAHGYYLTDDPAEVQRFTRSMLHRSREIARTARAVEKAAGLL